MKFECIAHHRYHSGRREGKIYNGRQENELEMDYAWPSASRQGGINDVMSLDCHGREVTHIVVRCGGRQVGWRSEVHIDLVYEVAFGSGRFGSAAATASNRHDWSDDNNGY